jgi:hypothetical protein
LENWKAAVPISNPTASVDRFFIKIASLLVLLAGKLSGQRAA